MSDWKLYKRLGEIEAREWTEADAAAWRKAPFGGPHPAGISISGTDTSVAITAKGFVGRNPANHADQWYIAPDYFAKHYAPAAPPEGDVGEMRCATCGAGLSTCIVAGAENLVGCVRCLRDERDREQKFSEKLRADLVRTCGLLARIMNLVEQEVPCSSRELDKAMTDGYLMRTYLDSATSPTLYPEKARAALTGDGK